MILTRRELVKGMGLFLLNMPLELPSFVAQQAPRPLRFGVIADVHQDIMHDGVERLRAFIDAMSAADPNFVVQLGDFCVPHDRNREFLETWNRFKGSKYHVIGNHDTDGGFNRDQVVKYYGMPSRYYSYDCKAVHFVVLDGNDRGGVAKGYPRHIGQEQLQWLAKDLRATKKPTVVFVHQPLDSKGGVDNREDVRGVLEKANTDAGWIKVMAVLAGHNHIDYVSSRNGIYYVTVNSSSYQWVGAKHKHRSYSKEIHAKAPSLDRTCPYRDPLWASVSIDTARGILSIEGRTTTWVGKSPTELGVDTSQFWGWDPAYGSPTISNWRVPVTPQAH